MHTGRGFAVIDCIVTYDSKQCIAICKNELRKDKVDEFTMNAYCLKKMQLLWK